MGGKAGGRWDLRLARWQFDCDFARQALEAHDGDRVATAISMGISESSLWWRLTGRDDPPWEDADARRTKPKGSRKKPAQGDCVCAGAEHDAGCVLGG